MNMERMMKEMERMMGAPPKKPLVSQLLDVERLSESERNSLRGDADRQLEEGMRLLQEAIREADQARRKGDSSAVERAMAKLREGATHWDTGYAVQRALTTPPPAARESAVKWFKAQMDVDAQPPTPTGLPWGVSWMHLAVMSAFALLAAGSIALYTYRVRRALSLLGRLTRGDEPR
jgi:hypothetical protein